MKSPFAAIKAKTAEYHGKDTGRAALLISAPFVYTALMLVVPIFTIITFSFWTQNYLDIDKSFTWANHIAAWSEPIYATLMWRSLGISAVVTACTVALAYPLAFYISFHVSPQHKTLWLFLITIPFWTSYLLRVFAWKIMLGYNGVLNTGLLELGIIDAPIKAMLYNVNAVVITLTHAWAPFAILPIFVSLEKIDRSLIAAAKDLGDNALRRFYRVILPLSMPGVIAALLIVFIPTVGDYITPGLVGGKDGVMIANMVRLQVSKANNWPLGAALAVNAMIIVAMLSVVMVVFLRALVSRIR